MIVVNLWGEPGSGKSTTAFGLTYLLKINLFKTDMVPEYAKELHYEGREDMFGDQTSIFAEQNRRLRRLLPHDLDYAVVDSPLPLPILYKPEGYPTEFDHLVMRRFHSYNNLNYLLKRTDHAFEKVGRRHNEEQAREMGVKIQHYLDEQQIPYQVLQTNPETPAQILRDLMERRASPILTMPEAFRV